MDTFVESVLSNYLESYRGLIEAEPLDEGSVLLSFPFHYSGNHRIEVAVTRIADDAFLISDMAKTIEELQSAGYEIGPNTKKRIEGVAKTSGLALRESHLILESGQKNLGENIQRFVEAAKTIADVYLVYRGRTAGKEADLVKEVKHVLNRRKVIYKEGQRIRGIIEMHSVDFLIPSNGRLGMAVSILSGTNSHLIAEAWGFKAEDIKNSDPKLKVGLIYDVVLSKWSDDSKNILEAKADLAIPGNALSLFDEQLLRQGIAKPD